jgi:hypothetical protein
METVREILAAHGSGISKPGLLAWARLRIDTKMTDAQLDEELARLGDEVVDEQGFLYLRSLRSPTAPSTEAPDEGTSPWFEATTDPRAPDTDKSRLSRAAPPAVGGWTPPPAARRGFGGIGKVIGAGIVVLWILGFVGGFVGDGPGATPMPTGSADPTPDIGTVVGSDEIAVGDCLVVPTEEFSEVRRVPCDTPHGGEVFFVVDHPGNDYPTDNAVASFVETTCTPVFATWTGTALGDQALLDYSYFSPTEEGWAAGNRTVHCYLYLADGSLAQQSYRNAKP